MSDERRFQARPTVYRGIRMRSRLEAKVAALLDELGKPWTYEGDAFASQHGQYLPDFTVGEGDDPTIIEVKPLRKMTVGAFERMSVVWDSKPEAALAVVSPDEVLHPALTLLDGEAWVTYLLFPRMPCGHVRDLLLSFEDIRAALDHGGLSPVELDCHVCGTSGMPTGFWGEQHEPSEWASVLKLLGVSAFTSHMVIEKGAGPSLSRFLPDLGSGGS